MIIAGATSRSLVVLFLAGCLEASGLPSQAPSRESGQASAVVSGRVFDGDGETPARFAQVQLSSRTRTGGTRYDTLTSEDGRFAFDAVQPSTYHLAALKLTYPPAFYSPDERPAAEPGAAIPIGAGQALRDLSIRVRKGGVIAGKVTDQNGEPVSVPIALRRLTPPVPLMDSPFYFNLPSYFRTDARGDYRIYGLAPDDYYVMTDNTPSETVSTLPDGRRQTYARAFFPDTTDPMAAVPVTVAAGQERDGIDLTIPTVPLVKLAGTIAGPADLDSYISLSLVPVSPAALFLQAETTGGSNGRFAINEVRPGPYWLSASARQKPPADAPRGTAPVLWWTTVPISMSNDDRTDVVLALQPAMSMTGQVVVDRQAADVPVDLKRYLISLTAIPGTTRISERPGGSRPADDGHFTVVNLTPGRYRLTVAASSGPAPQPVTVSIGGRVLANAEIEILPSTNIENVVVLIKNP